MQAAGRFVVLGAFVALTAQARAQTALPLKHAPARTQTAITPADLMTRLYLYSDDSMMGRLAGSEYNLKATAYIASEAKRRAGSWDWKARITGARLAPCR